MQRARAFAIGVCLAAGCGGGGGMPAGPVAPAPAFTIADGRYQLAVFSTGIGCIVATLGQAPGPPVTAISAPVDVTAAGSGWRIASAAPEGGTVTGALSRSGAGVTGSLSGRLIQASAGVVLQHQIDGGPSPTGTGVAGSVAGAVDYVALQTTAICATNAWSLERQ